MLLITLLAAMPIWGDETNEFYDFKVNGIAYLINEDNSNTVSVSKEQDPNIAETNYRSYANLTGKLTLTEQVTHDGETYTVTAIGLEAFQGCSGITGELVLPSTITKIDDWAFYQCSGLTGHLAIPDGVTTIGYGAFCECSGLQGVTIPGSVRQLDSGSLDCAGLQTVIAQMENFGPYAIMLNRRVFSYITTGVDFSTCRLLVPGSALSLYKSFLPWANFENIDVLENVDHTGAVDISDVNMVINAMLGKVSDPQVVANADVNCDETPDVSDLNAIINTMLGKHPTFYDPTVTIDLEALMMLIWRLRLMAQSIVPNFTPLPIVQPSMAIRRSVRVLP